MSDYVLEIAEYMNKMYKEISVDTWQFLLVQGPKGISEAIAYEYERCRTTDIVEARERYYHFKEVFKGDINGRGNN